FEPGKTPGSVDLEFLPPEPLRIGDLHITPVPVTHGTLDILGFRINDLGYVTDASELGDEAIGLLAGCDTLVLNGLRWDPSHPTHFTIAEAVEVARSIGARRTWLVHMSTPVRHDDTDRRLPDGI